MCVMGVKEAMGDSDKGFVCEGVGGKVSHT